MAAIILKELRENGLWAALAALVLAGLAVISALGWTGQIAYSAPFSLVSPSTLMLAVMAFGTAGFVLGVAQVLQDTRRGRWGFVIHRPISRWKTLAAKVIAGWILYLLATSLAIAALVVMAQVPQTRATPFAWEMTTLLFFAQAMGLLWHATGMLVASRHAAWLGSRIFPVVAGLVISGVTFGAAIYFTEALLYLGAGALLLLVAGGAYFVRNGEYEPQSIWFKPLQVVIVGTGVGGVMGLVLGITAAIASALSGQPNAYFFNQYGLAQDGQVYRYEQTNTGNMVYYDLSGKQIGTSNFRSEQPIKAMPVASSSTFDTQNPSHPRQIRLYGESFQNANRYLFQLDNRRGGVRWYYVGARRLIEGIGERGALVGSIGVDGFHPPGNKAQPFDGPLLQNYPTDQIATRRHAYRINLDARTVRPIFSTTDDDPILGVGEFFDRADVVVDEANLESDTTLQPERPQQSNYRRFNLVVTRKNVHVLEGTKLLFRYPIENASPNGSVAVGGDGTNFLLLFQKYATTEGSNGKIVRVDANGTTLSQQPLPPLPGFKWKDPQFADQLPIPFIPPGLFLLAWLLSEPMSAGYFPGWVAVCLVSVWVSSMALSAWMCRRYAFGRSAMTIWLVLTAIFGLGGTLTLYFVRSRPARVPCAGCGKKRVVNRERCEHCGILFARPAAPAIEIFEKSTGELVSLG